MSRAGWMSERVQRVQKGGVDAVLVVGVALVYAQVVHHGFINLDDDKYVSANPMVAAGLTLEGLRWAFLEFASFNWHPLTWLSHMLDVQLFGMRAGTHHLVNVAFHAANSVLLFHVLALATRRIGPSAVVAGLFALHPAHVESVAWVAERKDVLSTLFWFATMRAYLAHCRAPRGRAMEWAGVWFALGLLAKPMLVTLPFALLLFDFWPLRRIEWGAWRGSRALSQCVREKLPLFGLAFASCVVTVAAQASGGAMKAGALLSFGGRVANAFVSLVRYLAKAVVPVDLAIYYPHPGGWPAATVAGAVVGVLAITAVVLWQARTRPWLAVGWLWFLGTLVPVLGLVQVGSQAMADRYTYVPYIGLFIAAVFGVAEWSDATPARSRAALGVAAAVLAAFGFLSWRYVGAWQDSISIFTHSLYVTDPAYPAVSRGDTPPAPPPGVPLHNGLYTPYYNLGTAYAEAQKPELARRHFQAAIIANAGFPGVYINLGVVLAQQGDLLGSKRAYEKALSIDPKNALAQRNLAILREMLRR